MADFFCYEANCCSIFWHARCHTAHWKSHPLLLNYHAKLSQEETLKNEKWSSYFIIFCLSHPVLFTICKCLIDGKKRSFLLSKLLHPLKKETNDLMQEILQLTQQMYNNRSIIMVLRWFASWLHLNFPNFPIFFWS